MITKYKKDIFHTTILFFSFIGVFALGFFFANISQQEKPTIKAENISNDDYYTEEKEKIQEEDANKTQEGKAIEKAEGEVVASVNSDVYHYTHCPSVGLINDENKIYFKNAQEAENAGFTLAGNCTP